MLRSFDVTKLRCYKVSPFRQTEAIETYSNVLFTKFRRFGNRSYLNIQQCLNLKYIWRSVLRSFDVTKF